MILTFVILIIIFILGEILVNNTFFKYLKKYFHIDTNELEQENPKSNKFLGLDISVFKGVLERLVLYLCMVLNLNQVLIAFGALKIGTRIEKNEKIKNDYFLIGNFSSILIAIIYNYLFKQILEYF